MNKVIEIYVNGICLGSQAKGGYGIVIVFPTGDVMKISEFLPSTTNNRAELIAALAALNLLPDELSEYTVNMNFESNFVVKGITEWFKEWEESEWITQRGPVLNRPVWEKLKNFEEKYKINWIWIRNRNDNKYCEECCKLAENALKSEKGSLEKAGA